MEDAGDLQNRGEDDRAENGDDPHRQAANRRPRVRHVVADAEPGLSEVLAAQPVLHETQDHPDSGGAKSQMPVDLLAQEPADERTDHRSDVDPRVEDGKAGVATVSPFGIEVGDHRAHVRLQESRSHDDQTETEVEGRHRRNRHAEVAGRDDAATEKDGAPLSENPVGDPAARQRHQVNEPDVQTVDRGSGPVRQAEAAVANGGD